MAKNDIINVGDLTNKIYPIGVRENYRITSNAAMLKRGGSRTQPLSSGDGYDTITKVKVELHFNLKKRNVTRPTKIIEICNMTLLKQLGDVVAVIVWWLDLPLPMRSDVVS